jgi:GDP-L-fucose synthase
VDLLSVAKIINTSSASQSEIKIVNPGLNTEYTGSNQRLLRELGGFEFTSYKSGVEKLRAYYAQRLQELDLETVKKDPYLKMCRTTGGAADKL